VSIEAQHLTPRRNAFAVFGAESGRAYLDLRAVGMSRARPGLREAMATSQATDEFASRRRDRSTVTHLSRVEQFVTDDAADTEPSAASPTDAVTCSVPARCPQDRTSWHVRPATLAFDERLERPGRDHVEAADVHGLDLPGAEQLVHQGASDAEPVSGLDDGQQELLIALDRQVDDLSVRDDGCPRGPRVGRDDDS
jgi:hypothetical protein